MKYNDLSVEIKIKDLETNQVFETFVIMPKLRVEQIGFKEALAERLRILGDTAVRFSHEGLFVPPVDDLDEGGKEY